MSELITVILGVTLMPKGNATAQAYRVKLKAGKPAFIYKGLTASSQIVKANASAVNSVLSGFSIHINVNDKNEFDKAWNEAQAAK